MCEDGERERDRETKREAEIRISVLRADLVGEEAEELPCTERQSEGENENVFLSKSIFS